MIWSRRSWSLCSAWTQEEGADVFWQLGDIWLPREIKGNLSDRRNERPALSGVVMGSSPQGSGSHWLVFSNLFYDLWGSQSGSNAPVFTCMAPLGARFPAWSLWFVCVCASTSHLPPLLCLILSCTYWMWPHAPLPASIGVLDSGGHRCSLWSVKAPLTSIWSRSYEQGRAGVWSQNRLFHTTIARQTCLITGRNLQQDQASQEGGVGKGFDHHLWSLDLKSVQNFSCFYNRKTDTKKHRTFWAHPAQYSHICPHIYPDVPDRTELFFLLSSWDKNI